MRTITKQVVLLFVVFVLYFGYSAWVDSVAVFHNTEAFWFNSIHPEISHLASIFTPPDGEAALWVKIAPNSILSGGQINAAKDLNVLAGLMAQNSLLLMILTPFKLVLVGGVFALLIPLTKTIFFGTIVGVKNYIKARRGNVLYNYQNAIAFVEELNARLTAGDYEKIKLQYAAFSSLVFKPQFLINMMDEIGETIIKEGDTTIFIKPGQIVLNAIKEMYEKERKLAISKKPEEMFFDIKRGYEYTSIGSKYAIAYYKTLEGKLDSRTKMGWKLFSLEMFKFYLCMVVAIVPTIIFVATALPVISKLFTSGTVQAATPGLIIFTFIVISIIIHAIVTFTRPTIKNVRSSFIVPALVYYFLLLLLAATIAFGLNRMISQVGNITDAGSNTKMWKFFSALGYVILSFTLIMYAISTLMDGFRSNSGLTKKLAIDGIIIPMIAWTIATALNFIKIPNEAGSEWALLVAAAFWIYLSVSSILINNLTLPNRKRKNLLHSELSVQGLEAQAKKETISKPNKESVSK